MENAKLLLRDNTYLNHLVNVTKQMMENYEIDAEEKDKLINYTNSQLQEYEKRHGKLDPSIYEKLKHDSSLVPLSHSKRYKSMLNKFETANSQVINKLGK